MSSSHYPDFDHLEQVLTAWPRLFRQPPVGMQPADLEDGVLLVLCQTPSLAEYLNTNADDVLLTLAHELDGSVEVSRVEALVATRTEIFLARQIIALRAELRDFNVGF